uniref:EB domain-containing protein n=1 Tax=Ascaris lumbricoides TaxID=6252 RepID=A0A0M3HYD4_ASCLU
MVHPIIFAYIIGVTFGLEECYHAWSVRSEPTTCSARVPCEDENAQCVYSLITGTHICCRPRDGAVMPVCPYRRTLLAKGRDISVACTPGNDDGDDACPVGFQCVPSLTDFTRDERQPQFVCCRR